jgi:hypothetical protein
MKYFDMEEVINKQKDFVEKVKHLGGVLPWVGGD